MVGGGTVRVSVVLWESDPLVPRNVTVELPVVADIDTERVAD
jgi:hypothetical protein